ncbi:MAG: nuclear transport factor 2 family protein [Pseudomonadota bacterium]
MDPIQRTVEKMEILDLLGRYCLTIDDHDIDAWVSCFTEDGVFGAEGRALIGREKIKAYGKVHTQFGTRHITCAPVYEIADDGLTATGNASTVVTVATERGFRIAMAGSYTDQLKKVDGRWLIARRWGAFQKRPEDTASGWDGASLDPDVAHVHRTLTDAMMRYSVPA